MQTHTQTRCPRASPRLRTGLPARGLRVTAAAAGLGRAWQEKAGGWKCGALEMRENSSVRTRCSSSGTKLGERGKRDVRLRHSEKQILRGPNRDMAQRHRGLPSWPQSSALAPGFGAPEPGPLLSLCFPLVASAGEAAAEPGAPGGPGPVGAKCKRASPHLSQLENLWRPLAFLHFLKNDSGAWDPGLGLPLCPCPQPVWSGGQTHA